MRVATQPKQQGHCLSNNAGGGPELRRCRAHHVRLQIHCRGARLARPAGQLGLHLLTQNHIDKFFDFDVLQQHFHSYQPSPQSGPGTLPLGEGAPGHAASSRAGGSLLRRL